MKTPHENEELRGALKDAQPRDDLDEKRALAGVLGNLFQKPAGPAKLSRYVLGKRLGAGGAGVVYRAHDPELERDVAIKLLHSQLSLDTQGRARLLREAQTIAQLDHPNIIDIFDVGSLDEEGEESDGIFIVMELVEGETLARWLRAERPWRDVLRTFIAAGRGLVAAHARGIVHRDFKPDNVLVGSGGVRVLDFGLARAAGAVERPPQREQGEVSAEDGLTHDGVVLGTPPYMAPEQHAGRPADARSDQYCFCVALFEGLAGARPFTAASIDGLAAAKHTGDVAQTELWTRVPESLRASIMQGLSPNPDLRHPSMAALLGTLEPRPAVPGWRWLAGAAAVTVVALAAYWQSTSPCEGTSAHLAGVWDGPRRERLLEVVAGADAPYAADTADRVARELDRYATQWISTRIEACEETSVREQQTQAVLDLRMACLDRRLGELAALVDVLSQSEVFDQAVEAAGNLPAAEHCMDVDMLRAEVQPPSDPDVAGRVESVREQLARTAAFQAAGQPQAAREALEQLRRLAESIAYSPLAAEVELRDGLLAIQEGEYAIAESHLTQAYFAASAARHQQVAARAAAQLVFVVGTRLARPAEGRAWGESARAEVTRGGFEDEELGRLLNYLGILAMTEGEYAEALEHHRQALALRERRDGARHLDVATSLNNLGSTLERQGRHSEALDHHRRALAIRERVVGPSHPSMGTAYSNLGIALGRLGQRNEATRSFTHALAIEEATFGPDNVQIVPVLNNLGAVSAMSGELGQALAYHRRALRLRERAVGAEHPGVALSLGNIGNVLATRGRLEEAREHHVRALAIQEAALRPDHPEIARSLTNLGDVLGQLGDHAAALEAHERALAIRSRSLPDDHELVARSLAARGETLLELGRANEAITALKRGVTIGHGSDPARAASWRFSLARALWRTGDRVGGRSEATAAREVLRGYGDEYAATVATIDRWLLR